MCHFGVIETEHNCLDFNPICPGWGWGLGQTWNLHPTKPLNIKGQKDTYIILPSLVCSILRGIKVRFLDHDVGLRASSDHWGPSSLIVMSHYCLLRIIDDRAPRRFAGTPQQSVVEQYSEHLAEAVRFLPPLWNCRRGK